jgi:HlyD family secretion protein
VRKWCLAVLIFVMLLTTAAVVVRRFRAARAGAATPAREFTVAKGDIVVTVREAGTVEPFTKVEVKSKVGGRVLRMAVEEGQRVRPGQLLAELDRSEIQSQVNQIQAQIAAARARLAQAETELQYQQSSTELARADADQGLLSAQSRLKQAQRQSRAQPALTRSAIAQAEANCRAAEASLAAMNASTHPQMVADAQSTLAQAEANADNTGKQLRRMKALVARGFVPENQVDDAQRDYENACSQRDAAKERVATLEQRLAAERREAEARVAQMRAALDAARTNDMQDALREDELAVAQAGLEQARVVKRRALAGIAQVAAQRAQVLASRAAVKQLEDQLTEAMVRLNDTTILAPISGTITKRYIEAGELVTSGIATFSSGMPLVQIGDLTRMRVVCNINEVDVARVHVGQRAEITLDAARGQRYTGRVVSVAPAATTPAAGQGGNAGSNIIKFQVKIAVLHTDGRLRPGMSADVDIITAERHGVLKLPLEAVDTSQESARVEALRGSATTKVDVQTGLKNETAVEIRAGLKEGDRVRPVPYRGPARRQIMRIGPN